MNTLRNFSQDLVLILTEPRRYFEQRFPVIPFSQALAFGVFWSWIAVFLGLITRVVKRETVVDSLKKVQDALSALPFWKNVPDSIWSQDGGISSSANWVIEASGVVITPFVSLFNYCLYGVVIFIGAWLVFPKSDRGHDRLDLSNLIKLCAVSSTPALVGSILGFLPLGLGPLIGTIYQIAILTVGLGIRYRVSFPRAFGAIVVPGASLLLVCGCIFGISIAFLARMFS